MITPTRHASSPTLTTQHITWAQFICKSGEGAARAAPTPLVDRDLPTDIPVLICLDSLSFLLHPPPPPHRLQECSQDGK